MGDVTRDGYSVRDDEGTRERPLQSQSWHPGEETALCKGPTAPVDSPGVCEKRKCSMAGTVGGEVGGEARKC